MLLCCCLAVVAVGKHRYTLVIDAGHGGKDAGACANGAKEKNINLKVALAFGRYVENNCPDVRVIYTRKTDVFIPLHQRADIANRNKADVFISIHTNAMPGKKPRQIAGMETYTMGMRRSDEKLSAAMRENEVVLIEKDYQQHYAGYDPRSPESMMIFQIMNEQNMAKSVELASLIQRHTCSTAGRKNNGVRQDAFLVLRETSMPACLVELGYITTKSDVSALTNPTKVDQMGKGIYQAFVAFKNREVGKAVKAEPQPIRTEPAPTKADPQPVKVEPQPEPVLIPKETIDSQLHPTVQPVVAQSIVSQPVKNQSVAQPVAPATEAVARPVFKVQFLTSSTRVKKGDKRLKGLDADVYREGGLWKYTVGASENYNEIRQLRNRVAKSFPQAFIIAFRNGEKMDAAKAYQEFVNNRKK